MPARQWKAKLAVVDLGSFECCVLVVTIETILRHVSDWVARYVTINAGARRRALTHLGVLVTSDTGLVRMLSIQCYLREVDVL